MDKGTCSDAITKIDEEIYRIQASIVILNKQPGNLKTKIQELKGDLEFFENLKKTWEGKRTQYPD